MSPPSESAARTSPQMVESVCAAAERVSQLLLQKRTESGFWEGRLSDSALSTATAVMALHMVASAGHGSPHSTLIADGLRWLADHQNEDGGWGDTVRSFSNISTSMLVHAAFVATGQDAEYAEVCRNAADYVSAAGGVDAVLTRYGRDRTFSVPILTHCALAGMVSWQRVIPLPFELACLPARFYKTVRLPVVSYALPALIAIGQVIHRNRRSWNPVSWLIRRCARKPTLRVLERIQPENGGFLEATPLTSFVTMSLAGCGLAEHPVARKGVEFIVGSVRPDGSWPIDTNLATWVTTLSANAIGERLLDAEREGVCRFLLDQQYRSVHPYTNADPGGWSWTDLPGGVPDADDSPGAILALLRLNPDALSPEVEDAIRAGVGWLLDLQNRDGGWPTFCRGWGKLPFDRSSPDITAHVIRALRAAADRISGLNAPRTSGAVDRGFGFLKAAQREDGFWLPLWFGNQFATEDGNPVYGTSKVLAAFSDCELCGEETAKRGLAWLTEQQNDDGGWGGERGTPSSVEETSLAVDALLGMEIDPNGVRRGLEWLIRAVESGSVSEPSPIGFYFAKLWYFEDLYPLIFAASALNKAAAAFRAEVVQANQ